ncbi:hypothetical protein [Lentzea aerocolonigenes]|uniref:hypothetical protein n=1 Tax=Lentzea aerocolonigenes TaxID=68170 RepID=UPI0004C4414F|nr:hypothetical protein [Lentzea aerocolonigenes]MCP2246133.1 hypothetical protein [Lentzea aerocolonigenes]
MSRAHAKPERRKRVLVAGIAVAATLTAGTAIAAFAAGEGNNAAGQSIACPKPVIPAVPAQAQAEVQRELANLDKQIAEANNRLRTSAGQGGPNFVQNAIVGPLKDKRVAALNRIETAIGRVAEKPEGLERFAPCGVGSAPAVAAAPTKQASGNNGNANGNGNGNANGNNGSGNNASASGKTIECPLPVVQNVPAQAKAEVDRELANLGKQQAEANERLRTSAGQGGPNFVQNAILGPLKDKRVAALNRIETAIGRVAAKPEGLERFATCSLK